MIALNKKTEAFLRFRYGDEYNPDDLPEYTFKALDQNIGFNMLNKCKKELFCFVGFIDLVGFSSFSNNKSCTEIRDFIYPFLNELVNILTKHGCLIDKTIGDEVMFIIPTNDDSNDTGKFKLGQIMGHLVEYANSQNKFLFRIAISYGNLYLDKLGNEYYSEWALFGEPIILASRLMKLNDMEYPKPIKIAYGIKQKIDDNIQAEFEELINLSLNFTLKGNKIEIKSADLKGVGYVNYFVYPNLDTVIPTVKK